MMGRALRDITGYPLRFLQPPEAVSRIAENSYERPDKNLKTFLQFQRGGKGVSRTELTKMQFGPLTSLIKAGN
jgi:hypothetical protein